MRACMIAYTFYESDNRVRRYAESLAARKDSVDVLSLSKDRGKRRSVLHGVRVHEIQKRKINEKRKFDYLFRTTLFLIKSFFVVTKLHLKAPFDIIHVHSVPDYAVFSALLPKLFGAKVILDIHDIVPEFYAGKFDNGRHSVVYNLLIYIEKICCSFSDHVIIANDIWWEKITRRSVKNEKCTTFLNYPDPRVFYRRGVLKPSDSPFTFIYPGTLNWHQGLDIALQALALVKKQAPRVQLQIYGKGPEEKNLIALAKSLHLSETVKFNGFLPLEEVAEKMETADAGLVPKRADGFGNEAFSTKIFEFMALGVPSIVSKTKIDQRYFNDTQVLFFEPGNSIDLAEKILLIAQNQNIRKKLVQNALAFVNTYSWDIKKAEYFDLLESVLAR